jgi:hypothetical protein
LEEIKAVLGSMNLYFGMDLEAYNLAGVSEKGSD